jgi:hypothetical protein
MTSQCYPKTYDISLLGFKGDVLEASAAMAYTPTCRSEDASMKLALIALGLLATTGGAADSLDDHGGDAQCSRHTCRMTLADDPSSLPCHRLL